MRKLTGAEIEQFSLRPDVKRIAVENFLLSVTNNNSIWYAFANLADDASAYNWNGLTILAIRDGIKLSAGA